MTRLAVVAEGHTEREFVQEVLAEHLWACGVVPTPILIGRTGGDVTVQRLASEMTKLLRNFDYVTSLVDYYGFRGKGNDSPDELEARIAGQIRSPSRTRMMNAAFPYVQVHEFEGLLFSNVNVFAHVPRVPKGAVESLRNIRSRFPTPEDINDDRATAPSKRIMQELPAYDKRVHGPQLAGTIGLEAIREACPRFNRWMTCMESLGSRASARRDSSRRSES